MNNQNEVARRLAYVAQVARNQSGDTSARIAEAEKLVGAALTHLERSALGAMLGGSAPAPALVQATAQQVEHLATHEALRQSNPIKAARYYLEHRVDIDAAKTAPRQP